MAMKIPSHWSFKKTLSNMKSIIHIFWKRDILAYFGPILKFLDIFPMFVGSRNSFLTFLGSQHLLNFKNMAKIAIFEKILRSIFCQIWPCWQLLGSMGLYTNESWYPRLNFGMLPIFVNPCHKKLQAFKITSNFLFFSDFRAFH